MLAPIRKVTDIDTAHDVYSLDPFCSSNIDYQRRGEDELTKLIYKVVQAASDIVTSHRCKYKDSRDKSLTTADEALKSHAWDFRWQMKHLKHNSTFYRTEVFENITAKWLKTQTQDFKENADSMAHKQHLKDKKAGGTQATKTLLDKMVTFAEEICSNCQIPVRYWRMHCIGVILILM